MAMTSSMSTTGTVPAAVLKLVAKRIYKFNLTITWAVQSVRRHLRQNPSSVLLIVLTASLLFNLIELFYGDILQFNGINDGLYNAAGSQLQRYTNISFLTGPSTSNQNGRDEIRAQRQTFDRNAYKQVTQRPKLNKKRARSSSSSLPYLSNSPSVMSRNKHTDGKYTPSIVDHPMNWKRAELQVPADAGELPMTAVTKHIQKLVAAYIQYTTPALSSEPRRMKLFDVIASIRHTGRFMSFLTVRNHRLHVVHVAGNAMNDDVGERERRDGRIASFLYWMRLVVHSHSSVNDVQFLLDFNDCPCAARMQMNADTKPTAALRNLVTAAAVACNYSSVVPVPVWTLERGAHGDVGGGNAGGTTMIRRNKEDEAIQWSGKQEMAIFEGSFVSSGRKGHCNVNNESRLAFLMSEEPDLLVVTIHPSCKHPIVASGISSINTRAMQAFKYIIHGEEHCRWSLRLVKLMYECPGSVLVKQHVHTGLYFEPLMAEYRQFVPTGSLGDEPNGDFDNLVDQIVWTKENEKVANRIRKEMNNFVKNFLSNQAIIAYLQVLLKAMDERGIGSPIDVTERDMRNTLTDVTEV